MKLPKCNMRDICTSKFKVCDQNMTTLTRSKTKLSILNAPMQYGTGNPGQSN